MSERSATRDPWERVVSLDRPGIYESNYLKANSPDGERALWIKHNLLRPARGHALGEFWAVLFQRGEPPVVAKREVDWETVVVDIEGIGITCGTVRLGAGEAHGALADIRWDLSLSGGLAPILHLPSDWMYRAGFPKKKLVTPAPNLRFDGTVEVAGTTWQVDGWSGLRGHNWGTEHAWRYAYGNCNLWDDRGQRAVDGFTARIRLGPLRSPLLSSLVSRHPDREHNAVWQWLGAGSFSERRWEVAWGRGNDRTHLVMEAPDDNWAGLRYPHPDGKVSFCYNTKFAQVTWEEGTERHTSRCGELEILLPEPMIGVALHPDPDWNPAKGDYRS